MPYRRGDSIRRDAAMDGRIMGRVAGVFGIGSGLFRVATVRGTAP